MKIRIETKVRLRAVLQTFPFMLFFVLTWHLGGLLLTGWIDKVFIGIIQNLMLYVFYEQAYKKTIKSIRPE